MTIHATELYCGSLFATFVEERIAAIKASVVDKEERVAFLQSYLEKKRDEIRTLVHTCCLLFTLFTLNIVRAVS